MDSHGSSISWALYMGHIENIVYLLSSASEGTVLARGSSPKGPFDGPQTDFYKKRISSFVLFWWFFFILGYTIISFFLPLGFNKTISTVKEN